MERLEGKIALITGAAVGIGLATVELFLWNGATVIMTDRDSESGHAAAETFATPKTCRFLKHDVASESDWRNVMDTIQSQFGALDILVNNAGIQLTRTLPLRRRDQGTSALCTRSWTHKSLSRAELRRVLQLQESCAPACRSEWRCAGNA